MHRLGQLFREFGPVDGFYDVEQRDGFLDLIGLQRTDEMQNQVGVFRLEDGEFGRRLLHAVFSKNPLSGQQRLADRVRVMRLADRDQRDGTRVAPCRHGRLGDPAPHGGKRAADGAIARDAIGVMDRRAIDGHDVCASRREWIVLMNQLSGVFAPRALSCGLTALVAAMTGSLAPIAGAADIDADIGGFVKFQFATENAAGAPSDSNRTQDGARLDGEMHLDFSGESDTGVTYGGRLQLLPAAKARDNGTFAEIGWAWGEFRLGDYGGAAKELSVSAPTIGIGQVDGDLDRFGGPSALMAPYALADDDSTKLTYLSPAILGFRLGLSYTPELSSAGLEIVPSHVPGVDVDRNVVELALNSARDIGDMTVITGAAFVTGAAKAGAHPHDLDGGSLGSKLSWDGFTLGGAFVYDGAGMLPLDRLPGHVLTESVISEINAGATYETGRWGFGVSWAHDYRKSLASNDIVAVGVVYRVVQGGTIAADLGHFTEPQQGRGSNTALIVETAVHF